MEVDKSENQYEVGFGPSEIELLSSSLRFNTTDIQSSMQALASFLTSVSPSTCKIKSRKHGILSKQVNIEEISLALGEYHFSISLTNSSNIPICNRSKAVRGIVIKTEELEIDDWISKLSESVALEAQRSENGRAAISKLLGLN